MTQNKSLSILNFLLFCGYQVTSSLLNKFGLTMEYGKTDVFHFSRSHRVFDPPPLNLSLIGGLVLCPKNMWRYLDYIFDRKLFFHQHINLTEATFI